MTTNVNRHGQVNEQFGQWQLTSSYRAGEMVIYRGNIYIANGAIPANTAFATGTTGATWTLQLVTSKPAGQIVQMTTGNASNTFLVRTSTGKIYSCSSGTNSNNNPGTGRRTDAATASPVGVSSLSEVVFIDLSDRLTSAIYEETGNATFVGMQGYSAYVLFDSGNLWAWGINTFGQLGLGNTTTFSSPKRVAANVAEVYMSGTRNDGNSGCHRATDYVRLVYRGTDGKVYACGYNGQGALGLGNTNNTYTLPTELPWAGTNPYSVWNLGDYNGCIIVNKNIGGGFGQIWVAGANNRNGYLGTGNTNPVNTAVDVSLAWTGSNSNNPWRISQAVGNFGDADSGSTFNENSTLMMWFTRSDIPTAYRLMTCGYGLEGQIGQGSNASTSTPYFVIMPGSDNVPVKQINVLARGSMYALLTDGRLFTWGYNAFGQLGLRNTTNQNIPITTVSIPSTRTIGLDNIKEILFTGQGAQYLSRQSTLVVRKNSSDYLVPNAYVACGYNGNEAIGNGTADNTNVLVNMGIPSTMNWGVCGTWTQDNTIQTMATVIMGDIGDMWMTAYNNAWEKNYNTQQYQGLSRQVRCNPAIM